jgi:FkbM family methyltransferase
MTLISYAQNGEDVILWRALQQVEKGFYIDVGACDPNELSVTRVFYDRGWNGINIEPSREFYERCVAERPRDLNLNVAVAARAGIMQFMNVAGTGLSTTLEDVAANAAKRGWNFETRTIPALTLADICESAKVEDIHFLKVDVEGGESAVLQGADFQRFRPWVLVIEATLPLSTERNDHLWRELVLNAGYEQAFFDGVNLYFVAKERRELIEKLAIPPNALDDFKPIAQLRAEEQAAERAAALEQVTSRLAAEEQMTAALQAKLQPSEQRIAELSASLEDVTARLAAEEQVTAASQAKLEQAAIAQAELEQVTAQLSAEEQMTAALRAKLEQVTAQLSAEEQAASTLRAELEQAHTVGREAIVAAKAKLDRMQRSLADAERRLAQQDRLLRDRLAHIQRQTKVLEQIQQVLAQDAVSERMLAGDLAGLLRAHLAEKNYQLTLLRTQHGDLLQHRDKLLASTSWRLTSPLRKTTTAVRVLGRQPRQFLPLLVKNLRRDQRGSTLPVLTPDLSASLSAAPVLLPIEYNELSHRDKLVALLRTDTLRKRQLISGA